MELVEKSLFLNYRRTNIPWELAIYQNLTHHGFDVFFDYSGIASGDFERAILANIKARAHFLVLLSPSALESKRNIVPLMLEGFDFGAPVVASQLTGTLEALKHYNGVRVPPDYFDEAMGRLRSKFLNVPLSAVLHPAPPSHLLANRRLFSPSKPHHPPPCPRPTKQERPSGQPAHVRP